MEKNSINGIEIVQDIEDAIDAVIGGKTITRYEYGDSLMPLVYSGEYLKITPLEDYKQLHVGDIVLCIVRGYAMTHMVMKIDYDKKEALIASTCGDIYGWTKFHYIFGKCESFNPRVFVEDEN